MRRRHREGDQPGQDPLGDRLGSASRDVAAAACDAGPLPEPKRLEQRSSNCPDQPEADREAPAIAAQHTAADAPGARRRPPSAPPIVAATPRGADHQAYTPAPVLIVRIDAAPEQPSSEPRAGGDREPERRAEERAPRPTAASTASARLRRRPGSPRWRRAARAAVEVTSIAGVVAPASDGGAGRPRADPAIQSSGDRREHDATRGDRTGRRVSFVPAVVMRARVRVADAPERRSARAEGWSRPRPDSGGVRMMEPSFPCPCRGTSRCAATRPAARSGTALQAPAGRDAPATASS